MAYDRIVRCGPKLRIAFQDKLLSLTENLRAASLITDDNVVEVNSVNQLRTERAARLLELIRNKVRLDPDNYNKFVKVLQQDPQQYKDILTIRELT